MSEKRQFVTIISKRDMRVKALLDSGASANYINIDLARKLGYSSFMWGSAMITLGNGKKIKGYYVPLSVKVYGRVKGMMALAIPSDEKLIIGHPFMQDNDVILDYKNEKIRFSKRIPKANRRLRL